jgi:hypothetical protein
MELGAFIYQPEVQPLQNGGFPTALAREYRLAYD